MLGVKPGTLGRSCANALRATEQSKQASMERERERQVRDTEGKPLVEEKRVWNEERQTESY